MAKKELHDQAVALRAAGWTVRRCGSESATNHPQKHRVEKSRLNRGDDYRGCLVVEVAKSSRLYWRIEGIMRGMAAEGAAAGR